MNEFGFPGEKVDGGAQLQTIFTRGNIDACPLWGHVSWLAAALTVTECRDVQWLKILNHDRALFCQRTKESRFCQGESEVEGPKGAEYYLIYHGCTPFGLFVENINHAYQLVND